MKKIKKRDGLFLLLALTTFAFYFYKGDTHLMNFSGIILIVGLLLVKEET